MRTKPIADAKAAQSQSVKALLALRDMILKGDLAPGDRLSELLIVERLGVSRTPVRAALIRLEEEGLVEAHRSGGFIVRAFTEREIHEAIELRGTLEGLAVRLAAERGVSSARLNGLQDTVAAIDALLDGTRMDRSLFTRYVELNADFHSMLVDLADSATITRQIDRVVSLPFASPSSFVIAQADLPDSQLALLVAQDQHRSIVEAISLRQGERAESLVREHARIAHRNLQIALRDRKRLEQIPGGALIEPKNHG